MPGLLSSIFDPTAEDGTSVQQDETSVAAEAAQDVAIDQQVGVDAGLTYEDADGTTHSMQFENDVGLNADVSAAAEAVLTSGGTSEETSG